MSGNANCFRFAMAFAMACISCATAISTCLAQDAEQNKARLSELTKILETQATAWNAGDLEKFMEAYWRSDALTFSSGGNVTRGWQQTLDRYRQRYGDKETMGHLTFSELEVTSLGSDAALMLGRWKLTAKGQDFGGNFSLVWRKLDNAWKIIHDHTSSSEPAHPESSNSNGAEKSKTTKQDG